jgi:hypothetical protein
MDCTDYNNNYINYRENAIFSFSCVHVCMFHNFIRVFSIPHDMEMEAV